MSRVSKSNHFYPARVLREALRTAPRRAHSRMRAAGRPRCPRHFTSSLHFGSISPGQGQFDSDGRSRGQTPHRDGKQCPNRARTTRAAASCSLRLSAKPSAKKRDLRGLKSTAWRPLCKKELAELKSQRDALKAEWESEKARSRKCPEAREALELGRTENGTGPAQRRILRRVAGV